MSVKIRSWLFLTGILSTETFQAEISNSGLFNGGLVMGNLSAGELGPFGLALS